MDVPRTRPTARPGFLSRSGEACDLIANFDWSATSLGPIDSWPAVVKTTVGLILGSPVPIVTLWGEAGVMIYNDAYAGFAGQRHPEILGADVLDAWPEAAEWNRKVMETSFHRGEALSVQDMQLELSRHGRSEPVWMNLDYSPVTDDDGAVVGVMAIVVETTAKVKAEQRISGERERLRRMFDSAPGFAALLEGPDYRFLMANAAYETLVGRSVVGKTLIEALPEVAEQGFADLLDNVARSGEAHSGRAVEVRLGREGDQQSKFVDFIYQPIAGEDGEPIGIFVQGHDVTDHKRDEVALRELNDTLEARVVEEIGQRRAAEAALQQAQKMESIGKLTGGVAHDFNNLLQIVSGNLQLLQAELPPNAKAERRITNAMAGVQRGAKLASQLLAFGRRQPLEPKVVNVGRLVGGMEDLLRRSIGESVEMETVVSPSLWNAFADPTQVENAVLNLAINARDAMDAVGKLTVEVRNAHLDFDYSVQNPEVEPGQYVMLAVSDTGNGMSPEIIERVFEPFFTTKPEGKGSGLGLSMVYGFAKQSNGHVKIYSEVGEGTTVRLYLPRVLENEDSTAGPELVEAGGGSETILVVEDDAEVRSTVTDLLRELGYTVLTAKDAASAVPILESGVKIDLLFTDVVMPGPVRSPELARKAKERMPNIAILFTSGYTENAIVHGGRLDPGVNLLTKPYSRQMLATRVRDALRRASPQG